jgi:hypothetical protein
LSVLDIPGPAFAVSSFIVSIPPAGRIE